MQLDQTQLELALGYAERGWRVFPVYEITQRGVCSCREGRDCKAPGKHPRTGSGFKNASLDPNVIAQWWTSFPDANIGLATGRESGVFAVDIDPRHSGFDSWERWEEERGEPVGNTLIALTGGGGRHLFFRYPEVVVPGRQAWLMGVDIKSDGGYVVLPQSNHISGRWYQWLDYAKDPEPAPRDLVQSIRDAADRASSAPLPSSNDILDGIPEGQRDDVLFRWACQLRRRHESEPDGGRRIVTMLVLEAAAHCTPPFPEADARVKVEQAFRQDHSDEVEPWMVAAATWLVERWPRPRSLLEAVRERARAAGTLSEGKASADWSPVDTAQAVRDAQEGSDAPTQLVRADGAALLYAGLLNGLHGASESGKTWIALFAALQEIEEGGRVLYVDFESGPAEIHGRLLALGADEKSLCELFTYIGPSDRYQADQIEGLATLIAEGGFTLTVLDGVTDSMSMFGRDTRNEADFAQFKRELLLPLSLAGSSLLTIDHVAKGSDGRDALGTQHKRASIRGAALSVQAVTPFARGREGLAKLIVAKDRPGHVRGRSDRASGIDVAGMFTLTPTEEGGLRPALVSYADYNGRGGSNLGGLAARAAEASESALREFLAAVNGAPGSSTNDLKRALGKRSINDVADDAERRGLIRREPGPKRAVLHFPTTGDVTSDDQ
jgi:hypothetical protein